MGKTIRAGWMIDCDGGKIRENVEIHIEGERIRDVREGGQAEPRNTDWAGRGREDDNDLVDLSHCTILPPLVDCHVHLAMSGSIDPVVRKRQLEATYAELRSAIGAHLHYLFSHGVLAARDGGDRNGATIRFLGEEGGHPELEIFCPGSGLHREGRYGRLVAIDVAEGTGLADQYRWLVGGGTPPPWVKVVNSGLNSLVDYGHETVPQFSVEELRSLVEAADEHGARVMVHANGREAVRNAIDAGCHSIEHGYFMGEENINLLAEHGIFWVPTIVPMKCFLDNLASLTARSRVDRKVVEMTLEYQIEQLALARRTGVRVATGTDSGGLGILHGESLVQEIKLFQQAGYSLVEALGCCTVVGAELLGLDGWGLRPGDRASFLVARGTPAQLPRKLAYLEGIWVDGRPSPHYRKNPFKHVRSAGN